MPTINYRVKVYAPKGGTVWNEQLYSDGTAHVITQGAGWSSPVDIEGNKKDSIEFISGGDIRSIRTVQVGNICKVPSGGYPAGYIWTQGVIVKMYSDEDGDDYIGSVLYGHVIDRVADDHYITQRKTIGHLPHDLCNDGPMKTSVGCACSSTSKCCSMGVHLHMEAEEGEDKVFTWRTYLDTNTNDVKRGKSWIYRWTWSKYV